MSNWNNLKQAFQRLASNPDVKSFLSSPVTKIIAFNTGLFLLWRIKGVSETFLVKHFSFERFNIREHRYHTLVTYAFSHFGIFSFLFDMLIVGYYGRIIRMQYGSRMVWWLYIMGALAGGISMYFGMPNLSMVIPQVGSQAPITAMLTFFGLINLRASIMLFFFPVRAWVLLALLGVTSLFEPTKMNLGGMFAGLLVYQLFKIRII